MPHKDSAPEGRVSAGSAIPYADLKAAQRWSAMEQKLSHPLLQALRTVSRGTLRIYLPEGSEVFYLGADPGWHASMRFNSWKTLDRVAVDGELALGEEFAAGQWHTPDLRKLMHFVAQNAETFAGIGGESPLSRLARFARRKLFSGAIVRARRRLHPHYHLGNDFYRLWLDGTMTPTGALFHGDTGMPFDVAQRSKYRRILARLDPQRGEHILDLGCGWGGFMEEAARLNVRVTGVTLSPDQASWAKDRLAGFGGLTEVKLEDYRKTEGQYDDVVSLGMFEQVGEEFWPDYMDSIYRNLKPGGRAMIQTAVVRDDLFDAYRLSTDFTREHIMPGGMLASRRRFEQEARRAGLFINDVFHFGRDHAMSFERWLERFEASANTMREMGYCERFIRKWRFHLAHCGALFEAGRLEAIQVELTRPRNG